MISNNMKIILNEQLFLIKIICTQLYGFKYFYLIEIIYTQLYGFKFLSDANNLYTFIGSYL